MMLEWFKKKIKISLLNEKWEIMEPLLKVDIVPRINEYIWLDDYDSYYRVMNVTHNIQKKHGIFIILEKVSIDKKK